MREFVKSLLRYVHGALTVITAMALVCYPASLFGTDYSLLFRASFSVLLPFVVTGLLTERVKNIFLYLLPSLASLAAPLLLAPDVAGKVFFTFISLLIIVLRIVDRINGQVGILVLPRPGMLVYYAVAYLIAVKIGISDASVLILRITFFYVLILIAFENLYRLDNYLEVNRDIANIPKKQIYRTNNFLLIGFAFLTALAMILFPAVGMDRLIKNFFIAMRDLFWALIGKIPWKDVAETTQETLVEDTTAPENEDILGGLTETDPPAWLTAVYNGITAAVFIIAAAIALFFLAKAIYKLIRRYYRSLNENGDEEEFLTEDKNDEKEGAFEKNLLKKPEWLDFSPNASVRRLYRKTVEKQKTKVRSKALTPTEIEDCVALPEDETRWLLHETYEKARYSKEGCSKEEAKKLRYGKREI